MPGGSRARDAEAPAARPQGRARAGRRSHLRGSVRAELGGGRGDVQDRTAIASSRQCAGGTRRRTGRRAGPYGDRIFAAVCGRNSAEDGATCRTVRRSHLRGSVRAELGGGRGDVQDRTAIASSRQCAGGTRRRTGRRAGPYGDRIFAAVRRCRPAVRSGRAPRRHRRAAQAAAPAAGPDRRLRCPGTARSAAASSRCRAATLACARTTRPARES